MSGLSENNILTTVPNDKGAREYLSSKLWPKGLQNIFVQNLRTVSIRFFVLDDSGSVWFQFLNANDNTIVNIPFLSVLKMNSGDGHKFAEGLFGKKKYFVTTYLKNNSL